MELKITIEEGETLQQVLNQIKMDVAGPFTLTIKTHDKKVTSATDPRRPRPIQSTKPRVSKKRGRPKGKRNSRTKTKSLVEKGLVEGDKVAIVKISPAKKQTRTYNGVKPWSNRESVWVANQDRPTDKKVAKIGNDAVSAIEALFAAKFGYRRTYKSLLSKWYRMRSKTNGKR